ncbi:enoyl-CoA hydratase/carnithine racemase [Mycolicibacterium sp. BK556]|uniref:enoyl-CoA hydratase/isomerase family protein n=1 Tax=Mycobacteriaceae TaxID=1762 RepID=UPI00105B45E2|nr:MULTISPECIES: enoyl-CoA hydratase/isomerase family protein [Mycobacteriaceae]MBB3600646.1 enoyl-CoA hydratase/carnithine racemase [Mycolicibacterium sp. BK556]MBB3630399.1 enoyl-CoA hydratase/carnithine racemase [Mycolicibacterium sp. BK607]TDO10186.1 enoyl-CoA hydratase/carnithine racemase [Mycobacterium sp. BK086]
MTTDLGIELLSGGVGVLEIRRPPNNFFDADLIEAIASAAHELSQSDAARVLVLASEGKNFCAGADFGGVSGAAEVSADEGARRLYAAAVRLFEAALPIVAAVQGAAVGGGLGLALAADFRVAGPSSRFAANFSRIGLHHGFGMTVTLPRVVGSQHAADLLITGRRLDGAEAYRIGLADRLVGTDAEIRDAAIALAGEIATAAPLAVRSIRETLRQGLADAVGVATEHERAEQSWLRDTADFAEGVRASTERRAPIFAAR